MSKIDIHKDEREAENVIKRAMEQDHKTTVKKEQRSMVFRAVTELKNSLKTEQGAITLREIRRKLDMKQISNEEIGAALGYWMSRVISTTTPHLKRSICDVYACFII